MKFNILILIFFVINVENFGQLLHWRRILVAHPFKYIGMDIGHQNNRLYISNDNGHFITSSDEGNTFDSTWSLSSNLTKILELNDSLILGAQLGTYGVVKSTNRGKTWNSIFPISNVTELSYDGSRIWGGTKEGKIFYSSDTGQTWIYVDFPATIEIRTILSYSRYVFVGTRWGKYYRSTNYGNSWNEINNSAADGYIIRDKNNVLWKFQGGNLVYSEDNGLSWNIKLNFSSPTYITIDKHDRIYCAEFFGLYRSDDYGNSWTKLSTIRPNKVVFINNSIFLMRENEIHAYNPNYAYVPGKNMFPLALNNQYQYYNSAQIVAGFRYSIDSIFISKDTLIDAKLYYMFTNSNLFYRYDKDSNKAYWRNSGDEGLFIDFNLTNGSGFYQFNTGNGTSTWVTVSVDSASIFNKMRKRLRVSNSPKRYVEDLGYYSESNSGIGGATGETQLINALIFDSTGNYSYYALNFSPEITFTKFDSLILKDIKPINAIIYHRYNNNNSIFNQLSEGVYYLDSVYLQYFIKSDSFPSLQKVKFSRLQLTNNYTLNFNVDSSLYSLGDTVMYRIVAKDKSIIPVYSYMSDSGFYQAIVYDFVNSIQTHGNHNIEYNLFQNYPNPFNSSTVIQFQLPIPGLVRLKMYNSLGEEVVTLINNEWREAGNNICNIYLNDFQLTSGIYFYQIRVGNFVETKKMVYLK